MLREQAVLRHIAVGVLREQAPQIGALDEEFKLLCELLRTPIDQPRFAILHRAFVDCRRGEHRRAVSRRLDEFQIGLGPVECCVIQRQESNVRGMQRRRIALVGSDDAAVPHAADILLRRRLEFVIEAAVRDDAKVQTIAAAADCLIDRRHQRLPVRAAVQRTEEDRHSIGRCVIRALLWELLQLILKEIDVWIELPQDIRKIRRRGLHSRDGAEREVIVADAFLGNLRVIVDLLEEDIAGLSIRCQETADLRRTGDGGSFKQDKAVVKAAEAI